MPQLPGKVTGIKSKVINDLITFCQSLIPLRSRTIRHNWTAVGVSSEVIAGSESILLEDLHFRVEQSADNKVKVHGGRRGRVSHGVETIVTPTVDSGTAAEYSGVKELTVTATTSYAIATIDNAYIPTSCTFSLTTNAPGAVPDPTKLVTYLAKITAVSASGYHITAIEPMRPLGDIRDDVLTPDALSLDYDATSHKEEIKGWTATAATAPFVSTDEFPIRPTGRGAVIYRTVAALTTYLEGVWGATWPSGWGSQILAWLRLNMSHIDLLDYNDDSHNVNDTQAGKGSYLRTDGTAGRNKMSGVIADSSGNTVIAPTPGYLYTTNGGNARVSVDWALQKIYGIVGYEGPLTIDWLGRKLHDSAGTALFTWYAAGILEVLAAASQFLISVVTDSDPTDLTKGAFVCKGGGAFKCKLQVGTDLNVGADTAGGNANVVKGNVDVQTAANYYKHNGNVGKTNADLTSGGIVYATLTKKRLEDVGQNEYVVIAS